MNIEEILDMLEDMIDRSWSLPLTGGRCVIDASQLSEMIDDIRLNLPGEIKQAKNIVADRNEILSIAKKEAETIVRRAEERARALVAQEDIIRQAQGKATEMLSQAQMRSKEMKQAAGEFSDKLLRETEETLTKSLTDIRGTRQALRSAGKNNTL